MDALTKQLRQLRKTDPKSFANALMQMDDKSAEKLLYDYKLWARDSQIEPEGLYRYWIILAGRGFGKTFTATNWIIDRARTHIGVHVVVGQHTRDLRTVLMDVGPSSIMKQCPPDFKPSEINWTYNKLTFPNGSVILGISGDNPESARGLNSISCVLDEPGKYSDLKETFTQLDLGLRGKDARMLISGTPVSNDIIKGWYNKAVVDKNPMYRLTTGSTFENSANLDSGFLEAIRENYANTIYERQEIYGEINWSSEAALFREADLEKYRVEFAPELEYIVVGVDPAITTTGDKTGIVVVGRGKEDGHLYVLADRSIKGTPSEWSSVVSEASSFFKANLVVAERNQGGLMVEHTLLAHDKMLVVKLVVATKGKLVRAEPVSLFSQQGRLHMVGKHKELEQQLIEYDGTQRKSPDSYDSMVWACIHLITSKKSIPASTLDFYI